MKKIFLLMLTFFIGIVLFGCADNVRSQTPSQIKQNLLSNKKVLIVFYSYSGNTKSIAQQINKIVGGDIEEIKTTTPYSNDYDTVVKQAKKENAENFMPEIKPLSKNIKDYDIIFVGTPVWWYTMSGPIRTFLNQNDFTSKTIIPFCTHGGGGESSTFDDIVKCSKKANCLKGFVVYGAGTKNTTNDLKKWIYNLDIK